MSNRNFDHRVIIQRLQNKNYARNLYQNNYSGQGIINNPQNSDGTASRYNTFIPGAQTEYYRGLLGGGKTVNQGGTFGIPPILQATVITPTPGPGPGPVPGAPLINYIVPRNTELDVYYTIGAPPGFPIIDLKYSTDNGINFLSTGPGYTFPLTITTDTATLGPLLNNNTYSIVIRAVNANGESIDSNVVTGTPYAPVYLDYDPNNPASYPGSGLNVFNAGTAGVLDGTISGLAIPGGVNFISGSGGASRNVFSFGLGGNISFPPYNFTNYMTISAWIYPYSVGQNPGNAINTIIANCPSGFPPSSRFKAMINTFATINWTMNFELASAPFNFNSLVTPNNTIVPDTWNFLTYVLNNTNNTAQLYKNGVIIGFYPNLTPGIVVSGQPFYIGQMTDNLYGLNGELGYIKLYNGILSGVQILSEFNASKASFGL